MLEESNKHQILGILKEEFALEEEYHMAQVGKYLHEHGAGPEVYGYKKMKKYLMDLKEIMKLQERIMNGVPQTIVVLHEYQEDRAVKMSDLQMEQQCMNDNQNEEVNPIETDKNGYPKRLQDFVFIPNKVLDHLERMASSISMERRSPIEVLEEAYDRAVEEQSLEVGENQIQLFTGVYTDKQEALYAVFSPNKIATMHKWALTRIRTHSKKNKQESEPKHPEKTEIKVNKPAPHIEFEEKVLLPEKTVNLLERFVDKDILETASPRELLLKAYDRAYEDKELIEQEDMIAFPLYLESVKGEKLTAICRPNRYPNQQPWALLYIGSMGLEQPELKLQEWAILPSATVNRLVEYAGLADEETARNALEESYKKALKERKIYKNAKRASFFTGLYNEKGDPLHAGFVKNRYAKKPEWVLNFIGSDNMNPSLPRDQKRSVPGKLLESFADMGNWNVVLKELAEMALPEQWDFAVEAEKTYYILRQYLCYTFYRLKKEDKICISGSGDFAAFNTGLVSRMYEDIYACFIPNEEGIIKWKLDGFCVAGERGNGKLLVKYFSPLPQAAKYYEKLKDLLYDPERQLIADYNHILIENLDRLPMEFIKQECYIDKKVVKLASRVEGEKNIGTRKRICKELAEYISMQPRLVSRLRNRLDDAIELAIKQCRWNYKTALPLYYPKGNCMSLMLPLSFMDDEKADVAFVVQLTESGNYQGQTILTLAQAYLDARLLCRLNNEWLNTEKAIKLMDLEELDDIGTMMEY